MSLTPLDGLTRLLQAHPEPGVALGNWRWSLRQQLSSLRSQLLADAQHHDNAWLAARHAEVVRERRALMIRVGEFGPRVLGEAEVNQMRAQLSALVDDLRRHLHEVEELSVPEPLLHLRETE